MQSLPPFLTQEIPARAPSPSRKPVRTPVLEKGIHHLAVLIQDSYVQWESSRREGWLQSLDPRIKLIFMVVFLVVVSLNLRIMQQVRISLFLVLLVASSRLDLIHFSRRIGAIVLLFGVLIPLPSLLNLFGNGNVILPLIHLHHEYHFWQYHLPSLIGVTSEGIHGMAMLALRIANSAALSMLVLYTTSFPDLIKALRVFRVPESFVIVIALSYKYVFAFSRTVIDMHMAKKGRLLGVMDGRQTRYWAAGRIACLFQKSQLRCVEVYKAMVSRGFEHKITLQAFPPLNAHDCLLGCASLLIAAAFLAW